MRKTLLVAIGCVAVALSAGIAQAGPCNTAAANAGSGPTTGHTGQMTTGAATTPEHPPTSTMNRATAGGATSSQDVQRQTHGRPTAAQQAEGQRDPQQNLATIADVRLTLHVRRTGLGW